MGDTSDYNYLLYKELRKKDLFDSCIAHAPSGAFFMPALFYRKARVERRIYTWTSDLVSNLVSKLHL
jgi:hypothetical protein